MALFVSSLFSSIDGEIRQSGEIVRALGLTDLALFTEARYGRHLTQSDLHTAFQDHPLSLDHFPTGSLVAPPPSPWRKKAMFNADLHQILQGMSGGGYD
jgi:hypothetical protein